MTVAHPTLEISLASERALSLLYEGEPLGENNTSIESEHHIATMMLTDISDFTAMSEKI